MILSKGLSKYAVYIILFATIIFYSTYFVKSLVFAVSYFPIQGNSCAFSGGTSNNCNTVAQQVNCPAGQYIPNFACSQNPPSCQQESGANSCSGPCSDCNGAGSCIAKTCVPGSNFACGAGSFCNNSGSCVATLPNGASCADCNIGGQCSSGNCGSSFQLLLPAAAGTMMQFSLNGCSSANTSSCVNTNDSDISYIYSAANAQGDWKTQAIVPRNAIIDNVTVFAISKYSGAGTTYQVQPYLVVNGTPSGGNFITVTASYDTYYAVWTYNPNTSKPWQPNDLNNLTIGVFYNTNTMMITTYVYAIAYYHSGSPICCDAGYVCCQKDSDCPHNSYCSNNDCIIGTPLNPAYLPFSSLPFTFIYTSISDSTSNTQGLGGYSHYLNIFWYVMKSGPGNPNIGIKCTLNNGTVGS